MELLSHCCIPAGKYPGMLEVYLALYDTPIGNRFDSNYAKKLGIIKAPTSFTKKATHFATPGIDTGEQYCNG